MKKWTLALMILAAASSFTLSGAQADEDTESMKSTLKQISEKQDLILAQLDAIQSELNVVKIRVSSR